MKRIASDRNQPNTYIIVILLTGIFGGLAGLFYFLSNTFMTVDLAVLFVLIFGAIATAVHFLFFRKDERYLTEVFIYCFAGWGPLITTLLLAVNFLFHSKPVLRQYELKGHGKMDISMMPSNFELNIEDHQYDNFGNLLTIHDNEIKCGRFAKEVWIKEANGLLGFKVIVDRELH